MELIFAYIDPGSGSLIIQALIAGLVAIPIFFRHQISRFLRAVRGGEEKSPSGRSRRRMTSAATPDPPRPHSRPGSHRDPAPTARASIRARDARPGLLPRPGGLRLPSRRRRLPPDPGLLRGRLGALHRLGPLRPAARTRGSSSRTRRSTLELAAAPPAYRVIRPEALEFISYPYEWSFSQLKDAALLTLRAQALAAEAGMTLRDASAYNVQFQRGRPVLIDSLSFERAEAGRPWVAYRQFCEHFLAPLALMSRVDIRLGRLLRDHLEGVPLDLAARLLPGRTRFSLSLGPHIHLHARAQRQHADDGRDAAGRRAAGRGPATMSASRLATLVESLRSTVEGLDWEPGGHRLGRLRRAHELRRRRHRGQGGGRGAPPSRRRVADAPGTSVPTRAATAASRRSAAIAWWPSTSTPAPWSATTARLRARGPHRHPAAAGRPRPTPARRRGGGAPSAAPSSTGPMPTSVLALALVHHLAIGANVPAAR